MEFLLIGGLFKICQLLNLVLYSIWGAVFCGLILGVLFIRRLKK